MVATIVKEYNQDFYSWTRHNAQLLRQGKFAEVDIENVAEEIESMGRQEKKELGSRLTVLLIHLLKWRFQPEKRSKSWLSTIKEQRTQIKELLEESPSLKYEFNLKIEKSYKKAVEMTEIETGIYQSSFPSKIPFSSQECLDEKFFPGE